MIQCCDCGVRMKFRSPRKSRDGKRERGEKVSLIRSVRPPLWRLHEPNPFTNNSSRFSMRFSQIGCMLLLPFRILVIVFAVLLGAFFASMSTIGLNVDKNQKNPPPLSSWRRSLQVCTVAPLCRICLLAMGFYTIEVDGR